eukprot:1859213-Ditylum_brightwellii.AAC.1
MMIALSYTQVVSKSSHPRIKDVSSVLVDKPINCKPGKTVLHHINKDLKEQDPPCNGQARNGHLSTVGEYGTIIYAHRSPSY